MDPEEESVEESLDDSSLEDSPGSLFLFWGAGLGALLGSRLGGRWGLELGLGAVWGAGWGFGDWGCTGGAHAGGAGASAATCWQCGGAGDPQGVVHSENQWRHHGYHAFPGVDAQAASAAAVRGGLLIALRADVLAAEEV